MRGCLGWVLKNPGSLLMPQWEAQAIPSFLNTPLFTWTYQHCAHTSKASLEAISSQSMLILSDVVFLWTWAALSSSHWTQLIPVSLMHQCLPLQNLPKGERTLSHYPPHSCLVHILPSVCAEEVFVGTETKFLVLSSFPWFGENRSGVL